MKIGKIEIWSPTREIEAEAEGTALAVRRLPKAVLDTYGSAKRF